MLMINSTTKTTAQEVAATFKRLFPKYAKISAAKKPAAADAILEVA